MHAICTDQSKASVSLRIKLPVLLLRTERTHTETLSSVSGVTWQVRQVHQMAAARSLVEEEFLGSLAGLPSQQLRERLSAKHAALQEQAASLAAMDLPEYEVRDNACLASRHLACH